MPHVPREDLHELRIDPRTPYRKRMTDEPQRDGSQS